MEFFELKHPLQQKILKQFKQALQRSVASINKDFPQFTKFNHYESNELQSEEKGQLTSLLERAISKRFVEKFNHLGQKTKISIFQLKGADSRGKDYVLQIRQSKHPKNIELNVEQKMCNQQKGKWIGNIHSNKCDMLLLLEIGNINYKKGINQFWAGIFDKSQTTTTNWKKSKKQNSGFSNLRLNIKDKESLYVLIGDVNTESSALGRKRKYILPLYDKVGK